MSRLASPYRRAAWTICIVRAKVDANATCRNSIMMPSDRTSMPVVGHVRRIVDARDKLLAFLTRRDVEPTNNGSERALRPSGVGKGGGNYRTCDAEMLSSCYVPSWFLRLTNVMINQAGDVSIFRFMLLEDDVVMGIDI
jgi:hypothetical protein